MSEELHETGIYCEVPCMPRIDVATSEAVEMARRTGSKVAFQFNGLLIEVSPGDDEKNVMQDWSEQSNERSNQADELRRLRSQRVISEGKPIREDFAGRVFPAIVTLLGSRHRDEGYSDQSAVAEAAKLAAFGADRLLAELLKGDAF